jgi:hypothetical protein
VWRGKFCVQVELELEGHEPVWSRRNIDVGEPLRRGEPHSLTFPVGNWPHTEPVTVTLGLRSHRPEWSITVSPTMVVGIGPGEQVSATLTVTPAVDAELGTGHPIVDVEAYVEGMLLGGFRKVDRPPIAIHKPHERVYAETELSVHPDPPQKGQPATVSSVIQNASAATVTVDLEFGWAKFGMGIPFTHTGMSPYTQTVDVGPATTATASVTWTPSLTGSHCVIVHLTDPDGLYQPQHSQRNVRVIEEVPCGVVQVYTFTVYNDSLFSATVDIGTISFNVPEDWVVTVLPSTTLEIGPFLEAVITVTVEIPCPGGVQGMLAAQQVRALQEEAGAIPTIDVEGYIGGVLVGGIEIQLQPEAIHIVYLPITLKNRY